MPVLFTNNASTTLSAGINNSQTTIAIASASGFPSLGSGEYYYGTIANTNNTKVEVVKVTAGTTSLTVTRAQDGTTAQAFNSGDNFQLRVTAATLDATSKSDVAITAGSVSADTLIAKGDGASADGQIQLNCSQNSHGIKLKSPPHSAGADYTLTFPNDDGDANQYLQTNGSGVLDWNTVDLTALSASNLTSGTVPAARITASSIANDLIDSQHYADGSIDTAHIADDQVTADKLANSINTDIATGVTANTTANAALPKSGGAMTGAITTNSTFDGRDVATDGAKLDGIAASANNYVHPNHSGEVTSTADGATVIADNVVDEANLKVSNAPTNGYFLSAQSGNTGGLTWAEVVSEDYIPNGSVMVFFQANAPTGWTKVTTQNDKTLRVVSGTGGGTGGDWAMSAGETTSSHGGHVHSSAAHTHNGAAHSHNHNLSAGAHTLSTAEMPSHSHTVGIPRQSGGSSTQNLRYGQGTAQANFGTSSAGSSSSHSHSLSGSISSGGDGATGSTTPGDTGSAGSHTHTIAAPQYIDVIICSKDA